MEIKRPTLDAVKRMSDAVKRAWQAIEADIKARRENKP